MGRMIDADALKEYIHNQDGRPFIGITIGEAFQMMVDEQPTIEERKTGDLISRQAAIDAFANEKNNENTPTADRLWIRLGLERTCEILRELPSAQPERDIPMKPNETIDSSWGIRKKQAVCPKCDYYLNRIYFLGDSKNKKVTYCETCGQAIDWEGWDWEDE